MLPFTSITKFTLQDYPDHIACIVWLGGCNLRCSYCHNPEFVIEKFDTITEESVLEFLNKRKDTLEAVVFSGGECSMYNNHLYDFIKKVKDMGYLVKIDTNGTNPELVEKLISEQLLDFIALDFKAPQAKYLKVSGVENEELYGKFCKTLSILTQSPISYEIRTTVHTDLLNEDDVNEIIHMLDRLNYTGTYYIQNYRDHAGRTLGNMPDQSRILDRDKIVKPESFKIDFRNF